MRFLLLLLFIVLLLPVVLIAQSAPTPPPVPPTAQPPTSTDWSRVGVLEHDQPIVVSARGGRTLHCLFTGVTNADLFCEPQFYRPNNGEWHFDRADIETVRLEQARRNMKITIWTCALAGAAWGAADSHAAEQGAPRLVSGLLGAGLGATAGLVLSLPVALLVPGRLIYRHPSATHALSASDGD